MKRALMVIGLLLFGLSGSFVQAGPLGVSFGVFYSSLGSYGEWIPCDGGVYAWRPIGVAAGWRPYFEGRWCWTDDGWYWASEEPWAWATYHYGRWYNDDFYGWVWVPGYDWAPAWVEWRYGGGCIGWAPLSPYAVFSISFGVHYRSSWITPHHWWSFVDCRYISDPYIHRYVYRTENNTRYIGRTRSAGSVRYDGGRVVSRGPDRGYVEQRGNIRVERAEIRDVADHPVDRLVRDGGRERVEVYRPRIESRAADDLNTRPERVRQADRTISLDTRGMDVRAREVDREAGRDMRRAEELRKRDDGQSQRGATRSNAPRELGRGRGQEADREPDVNRGRERDAERRSDAPSNDRGRRREEQRDVRRERQVERNPAVQSTPPRRDDAKSVPEWRTRRPESPSVGRVPAPRHEPQQGGRSGDSGTRGGGKRR